MTRILKKLFGILALLIGASILVWFIYNQFAPTPQFKRNYTSFLQLGFPIAMIWIGWRWLTDKSLDEEDQYAHFVFAKIVDPVGPAERRNKYADPLNDLLAEHELGEVSGGGTELTEDGKVAWVGLDIELANLNEALEFTRMRLRELGAPRGSVLEYEVYGENVVLPIW